MSVQNQPKAAFGRRGGIRPPEALNDRKARPARLKIRMAVAIGVVVLLPAFFGVIVWALRGMETLDADAKKAEQRVIEIVNQPITHLSRTAQAGVFSPGWFHPGDIEPAFSNVDIRNTQEFPYRGYAYVTSDVTPSEMFIGDELELNSMTKYFYTDRTLPKKRLSEPEMLEINSLYRAIGSNQQALVMRLAAAGLLVLGVVLGAATPLLMRRG